MRTGQPTVSSLVQTLELQERHARPVVAQVARPSALVFLAASIASMLLMAFVVGALWAYAGLRDSAAAIRVELAARAQPALVALPAPAVLLDDAAFARLVAARNTEAVALTRARAAALAAAGRNDAARDAWVAARTAGGADVAALVAEAQFLADIGQSDAALAVLAAAQPQDAAGVQAVAALVERCHLDAAVRARRARAAGL